MATLTQIRQGIQTRLKEISGLEVYDRHPEMITPPAAVVGGPTEVSYNQTFGPTKVDYEIPVRLYVARTDAAEAQLTLDAYVAPTGSKSIKAAIENTTVAVAAGWDFINVTGAADYASYRVGDGEYIGIEFVVKVVSA